eukprot:178541-Chlamydomonas_euryale.AAC.1
MLAFGGGPPGDIGGAVHVRRVLVEGQGSSQGRGGGAAAVPDATVAAPGGSPMAAEEAAADAADDVAARPLAAARRRLARALEVHLSHSSPDVPPLSLDAPRGGGNVGDGSDGADGGTEPLVALPQWRLQVDRGSLGHLVERYVVDPDSEAAALAHGGVGGGDARALLQLQRHHEAEAWRLVQALWGRVDGEDDPVGGSSAADAMDDDADGGGACGGSEAGNDAGGDCAASLAGYVRRRCVSSWLRRQAKGLVESELEDVAEPCEAVLRLLAAQQPAAATAVAVAAGDVRLATLLALAGAGARAQLSGCVQSQLDVWEANDMLGHVAPDRLLVYRLLAGQVRRYWRGPWLRAQVAQGMYPVRV